MSPASPAEPVWVGLPGPKLEGPSADLLAAHQPGGVVLFGRNCVDPEQLFDLVRAIRTILPRAILAIDAEGGRVDRLRNVVAPAPAASRLAAQLPSASIAAGRAVGRALRLFDLDVDFAPVVDLDRGHAGNALDDRCLGVRPEEVVPRARAFLAGLHMSGIGGCLKHYPGLGGAGEDTHHEGSVVRLTREELDDDLAPFDALGGFAGAVMISHAAYPSYDAKALPATLSPCIHRLLRRRLGPHVLAVCDDPEMKALAPWGDLPERTAAAFLAGCDVLPVCRDLAALPAIAERLANPALEARQAEAHHRIERYRNRIAALRAPEDAEASWDERLAEIRTDLAALA
ncbi:MAG TPA: glycoside hydrolase family 3 N-terminal domain-containing protein [Thermoanaerobaculia bacterium]|jgi:beta-N-acetylhexosaminidase|nr:glycoside hydrolase family 3 N-terminal domain-containing protein [Thermoanaerobaculia bacterium]